MIDYLEQGFKSLPFWLQAIITISMIVVLWIVLRPQPIKKQEGSE